METQAHRVRKVLKDTAVSVRGFQAKTKLDQKEKKHSP
jgi:hypothetical protein